VLVHDAAVDWWLPLVQIAERDPDRALSTHTQARCRWQGRYRHTRRRSMIMHVCARAEANYLFNMNRAGGRLLGKFAGASGGANKPESIYVFH
jgi:hypothetical protein